jgi:hypothetical protein
MRNMRNTNLTTERTRQAKWGGLLRIATRTLDAQ